MVTPVYPLHEKHPYTTEAMVRDAYPAAHVNPACNTVPNPPEIGDPEQTKILLKLASVLTRLVILLHEEQVL